MDAMNGALNQNSVSLKARLGRFRSSANRVVRELAAAFPPVLKDKAQMLGNGHVRGLCSSGRSGRRGVNPCVAFGITREYVLEQGGILFRIERFFAGAGQAGVECVLDGELEL